MSGCYRIYIEDAALPTETTDAYSLRVVDGRRVQEPLETNGMIAFVDRAI